MARTREFDPKEVIEKAVALFWEKGYSYTSMDDLVKHTGVSRYGIYGEFGNKRELFIAALEHFQSKFTSDLIQDLINPEAGLAELREYYVRLLSHANTPDARLGCFMCNTAVELSSTDDVIGDKVNSMFEGLRILFRNALGNGQKSGELTSDIDIEEYASYLLGVQMAVAMMVRTGLAEERKEQFLNVALAAIR